MPLYNGSAGNTVKTSAYVEGRDADGSHGSEDSEDSQSGQVDRHQPLLVAVGQTPAEVAYGRHRVKYCHK